MAENLKNDLKKAIDKNKRSEEQANKTSELKTCPSCGGEAKICGYYFIQCVKCGLSTLTHTNRESAINTWNTRKPLERVIERLEKERRFADEEKERCAMESLFQFDRAVGYSNGIFNAIELIKGEME